MSNQDTATATAPKYSITSKDRDQFVGILIASYLINQKGELPIMMNDEFKVLEPTVIQLFSKGYLKVDGMFYKATDKAKEVLKAFMKRYSEYLKLYDIYSAVDLTAGKFAFEKFFDFETDDQWTVYLSGDNWEDLRVAVAEFKKLNPVEIVFMSFINEGRFDTTKTGWQFDVLSDAMWDEILHICNTNLTVDQVNQGNNSVMPDIIEHGTKIMIDLMKKEVDIRKTENDFDDQVAATQASANQEEEVEEVYEETIVIEQYPISYYDPYYDPYYVSPIWLLPLFLF